MFNRGGLLAAFIKFKNPQGGQWGLYAGKRELRKDPKRPSYLIISQDKHPNRASLGALRHYHKMALDTRVSLMLYCNSQQQERTKHGRHSDMI